MKHFSIIILIVMAVGVYGFTALTARADIYAWVDENGVNHFTNYAPPKHAKLLMKEPEIPYDEEADNQRRETDRLEAARQELAEREAFLLQEQRAAESRIAEANARADAALLEADRILQEAEAAAENTDDGSSNGYVYGYYPPYKRHYRGYIQHYKKQRFAYPHYRHFKYGYQPRKVYHFGGSQPKHSYRRHHSSYPAHRGYHYSRAAAFRARHGRF